MFVSPVFRENSIHSRLAFAFGRQLFPSAVCPARILIILFGAEKTCSKNPILRERSTVADHRIHALAAHPVRSADRRSPVPRDSVPRRADHRSGRTGPDHSPIPRSAAAPETLPPRALRPGRHTAVRIHAGALRPAAHADRIRAGNRSAGPASMSGS